VREGVYIFDWKKIIFIMSTRGWIALIQESQRPCVEVYWVQWRFGESHDLVLALEQDG
jgi:hypothetical protein